MNPQLLEQTLILLFKHQLQLKMYHFQTLLYGAHKSSDSYLIKFENNLDKFMEVSQGIIGKLQMKQLTFDFPIVNDKTIITELTNFVIVLKEYELSDYPELLNLRDEMMADAQQLKYLLTFK